MLPVLAVYPAPLQRRIKRPKSRYPRRFPQNQLFFRGFGSRHPLFGYESEPIAGVGPRLFPPEVAERPRKTVEKSKNRAEIGQIASKLRIHDCSKVKNKSMLTECLLHLAKFFQLVNILRALEFKTLQEKWSIQPRAVQLADIHAQLQIMTADFDFCAH